jgi:hypothetical protein
MMFDDLTSTQSELIGHVKAACQAIKFLRNVEPLDCLEGKEHYAEWVQHMNKLNTARVRLGMAAEYLHTDLNNFNDAVIYAARPIPMVGTGTRKRTRALLGTTGYQTISTKV